MRPCPIALEITPPARVRPEVLRRRARALGGLPRYINVIQRPDRWSSLDASILLRRDGFEPVWHLANRGSSAGQIDAAIRRALGAGLTRVLCIRGEHKAEDGFDTPKIREVVRTLRLRLPAARVGVTLNHHLDARRAMRNLWPKLRAGAHSIQTQVTFDLESLAPLAAQVKAERPRVSIVPMLMPVLSSGAARRVAQRLSVSVPATLLRDLERFGEPAGWDHFAELAAAVRADPLYSGVAVMTPIDVRSDFAARLTGCLR
jgi:5,10-methylenetetrahydrofolate reductase